MEFIKEWTLSVCITLIIATIFSMLSPSGRMERFYKLLISIFICISLIYPFINLSKNDIKLDDYALFSRIESSEENAYENGIEAQIKQLLYENKIIGANIDCDVYINGDEIEISRVQIAIPSEYDKDIVENLIFDELGINAQVIYIGEWVKATIFKAIYWRKKVENNSVNRSNFSNANIHFWPYP